MEDADDGIGFSGVKASGGRDVFRTLTLFRVKIANELALGLSIERKPKVKNWIEYGGPGVRPRAAEKDEVLIRLKVLDTKVSRGSYPEMILARSHQRR
jgi:hypothetical protein